MKRRKIILATEKFIIQDERTAGLKEVIDGDKSVDCGQKEAVE